MTKHLVTAVIAFLLMSLAAPGAASAHVLKIDGHIGAVLHINPDDNPTTGESTDYVISFDDDTGKFSLPRCACQVSIIKDSHIVAARHLAVSSDQTSENRYAFATPGVYTLRFTGQPKQAANPRFQPFTLDYQVRVAGGQTNAQPMPAALWIGMAMAIGLVLLAAYAMDYDAGRPRSRTKHKEGR